MSSFVPLRVVAALAGVSERALKKAALAIRTRQRATWRGSELLLREVHGRGGRRGARYEVLVSSLPPDLQLQFRSVQSCLKGPANRSDRASSEREWRHTVILPALEHPRSSRERGEAVRSIAAVAHYHPSRRTIRVSARTLDRWISDHERGGFDLLTRRQRGDKGTRKAILTLCWDKAVNLSVERKEEIATETRQFIRDLWGNGAVLSDVTRLASDRLAAMTREIGAFDGPAAELARVCRLPRNVIEAQRQYARVAKHDTHRKSYEDDRPRIRRDSSDMLPMQLVIGDVHHCDVLVRREDGTNATPKLISWLDVGTGRLRFDAVLCEAGRSVRNADLIRSFVGMVRDPHWGMPSSLYLDNGSEYRFAEMLRDALKLANLHAETFDGRTGLIRAGAYNAPAKGKVERTFRSIEAVFSALPGYIGGDRMKSRSANVGKAPTPFPGSFAQWETKAHGLLAYYNTKVARSGRAPSDVYHEAVVAGWQRLDADGDQLRVAFSVEKIVKVLKGTISVEGRPYYADELFSHNNERVTVLVPKYETSAALPVFGRDGSLLCAATIDEPYPYQSKAGAVEAARRKTVGGQHIRALKREVRPTDVTKLMIASGEAASPETPVPSSAGHIGLSEQARIAGEVMREKTIDEKDAAARAGQQTMNSTIERLTWGNEVRRRAQLIREEMDK